MISYYGCPRHISWPIGGLGLEQNGYSYQILIFPTPIISPGPDLVSSKPKPPSSLCALTAIMFRLNTLSVCVCLSHFSPRPLVVKHTSTPTPHCHVHAHAHVHAHSTLPCPRPLILLPCCFDTLGYFAQFRTFAYLLSGVESWFSWLNTYGQSVE